MNFLNTLYISISAYNVYFAICLISILPFCRLKDILVGCILSENTASYKSGYNTKGYNVNRQLLLVNFFAILKLNLFFVVAMSGQVLDAETMHGLSYLLTASKNLFGNMSDDWEETAKCSFPSINHISEKTYRCC